MKPLKQIFTLIFILFLLNCSSVNPAMYNSPGRDKWQKPDLVIESLKIQKGSKIADLGAGGGYFTSRLAIATGPEGVVYAIDIEQKNLDYIKDNLPDPEIKNIQFVKSEPDDSKLSEKVDLIFSCNSYHHFSNRVEFAKHLYTKLLPKGRIAIIDFKKDGLFRPGHFTDENTIISEMKEAGFDLSDKVELKKQNFLIFSLKNIDRK
ncbi:MAG: class I SAM-dependent methyltransferase [Leptospiraceae bacterium]|nr:class I SAM-dependent methyltransferase [Leptospiraceae bacterium]